MEYTYNIDGIDFIASNKDISLDMKKIDFLYQAMASTNQFFFSLIVTDSKQIQKEIIKKLQQFGYMIYDLSKFSAEYLDMYLNEDLAKINNSLENAEKICIIETLKYGRLMEKVHNLKEPLLPFSTPLVLREKGCFYLYNNFFNFSRDFQRIHKSKVTIIMSELESHIFMEFAPDYYSYCRCINLNYNFKPIVKNINYENLVEYYINKIMGEENSDSKSFRKRL